MQKTFWITAMTLLMCGVIVYILSTQLHPNAPAKVAPDQAEEFDARERSLTVYESDASSPNECTSYEDYDSDNRVCYFECETPAACADINKKIDDELESWTDEDDVEQKFSENENKDTGNIEAVYTVSRGEQITLQSGITTDDYLELWEEVAAISPDDVSDKYVDTFVIYNNENDDTLAYVVDEDGNGKWEIGVNFNHHKSSTLQEQKRTLVHEIAHILSLNTEQITERTTCKELRIDEGCANPDSYLNHFYTTFWKNAPTKYSDNAYVTEYAATNEVEDFAESFAFFVFNKNVGDEAILKNKKIKFMYSYPEFITIRKDMREALGESIVRARKLVAPQD